jgi:hypothetical protein
MGNCKGASGKTSGRSIFQNAPLRATSSAEGGSRWAAIAKPLGTGSELAFGRVGFARKGKSLRFVAIASPTEHLIFPQSAGLMVRRATKRPLSDLCRISMLDSADERDGLAPRFRSRDPVASFA